MGDAGAAGRGGAPAEELPTNRLVVAYADGAVPTPSQRAEASIDAGAPVEVVRQLGDGSTVLELPSRMPYDEVEALAAELEQRPDVLWAEPDLWVTADAEPTDPLYATEHWHYKEVTAPGNYGANLPPAWDITTGSPSVVTAVLDTGKLDHADLAGRFLPGYDMISDSQIANDGGGRDADPNDPGDWITSAENASGYFAGCPVRNSSWHGTHVAGTIGAATNNGIGVSGINWVSPMIAVRVLGKCGGSSADIADAIRWAAGLPVAGAPTNANPADVINMSLSGSSATCPTTYQNAINDARNAGTVVVVAAGNNNADAGARSPSNCAGVITVGATAGDAWKATYSNYGSTVEISAPGGDSGYDGMIHSTLNTGTQAPVADSYADYQGTSMATPHVAGIVSLMRSVNPTITPDEVLTILQDTVTPFPAGVGDCTTAICGAGIVNAGDAVQAARQGSISGTVTGADTSLGLSGRTVELYKGGILQSSTTTDGSGNYTFAGLNPSTNYKLRFVGTAFYLPQFNGGAPSLAAAGAVTVAVGADTDVDASLIPRSWRATVTGTVTNRITGAPLQGITVRAYVDDVYYVGVPTQANGTYTIAGLDPAAGSWDLRFTDGSGTYRLQWWENGIKPQVATPVSLAVNTTTTADAQLTPNASLPTLSGTVRADGTNAPIQGIEVRAFQNGLAVDVRTTNASGAYTFGNLLPGTYTLRFSDPGGNWTLEWWQDQALKANATNVVLPVGGAVIADAHLAPAP
ncbi:MAG: S8 family serine peptidase [Acidimicrobiales bacterium]|nr:S8 family serine peptidase [Acidimicrobiales bacterium]